MPAMKALQRCIVVQMSRARPAPTVPCLLNLMAVTQRVGTRNTQSCTHSVPYNFSC
jgi:hypothetical protein